MVKRLIIWLVLLLSTVVAFADGIKLQGHNLPAYFKTTANLNIRNAPSLNGKKIATLPKATEVYVVSLAGNGFCELEYRGEKVYASKDYLTFSREHDIKKYAIDSKKIMRQGEGLKEFLWNFSVICYHWLFNFIGNWCMLVGAVFLILGWLLLRFINGESYKDLKAWPAVLLTAVMPVIVAFCGFELYDWYNAFRSILGWICAAVIIFAFTLLAINCSKALGINGLLISIPTFLLFHFGFLFFSVALTEIIKLILGVLFFIGFVIGLLKGPSKSSSSDSSSSYSSSDDRPRRDGQDMLPGRYGDVDKGEYVDDNTFVQNNGDVYYQQNNGEWSQNRP